MDDSVQGKKPDVSGTWLQYMGMGVQNEVFPYRHATDLHMLLYTHLCHECYRTAFSSKSLPHLLVFLHDHSETHNVGCVKSTPNFHEIQLTVPTLMAVF